MYTVRNFKTKKAVRDAFKSGEKIEVYQPNGDITGFDTANGRVCIEGPHYPEPHKWYASVEITDHIITRFVS